MNVIQTELSEAIADLAAKCPGSDIHVQVHSAPFEVFSAADVRELRVVSHDGRTWLNGRASGPGYRIEFYSVDLPQASSPDAETLAVVA